MNFTPSPNRYHNMIYNRCGNSGLKLPALSLGLWHNFGEPDVYEEGKQIVFKAFDEGITHFDLANNYGPPAGAAEENFGRMLKEGLSAYRNELVISTKAGYYMWEGPYGEWGSRKYLLSSLNDSLKRMGLEYVDIFYSHRPDPDTPLEETMAALDSAVRQGKALYVGISNYNAEQTKKACKILKELGTPCLINQPSYSIFNRWVEPELISELEKEKIGAIAYCPLAQGLLTNKYIKEIPTGSRAAKEHGFLQAGSITKEVRDKILALNSLAGERGQSLAQMALCWVLRLPQITSALIGVSRLSQLEDNLKALGNTEFSREELEKIDEIVGFEKVSSL